MDGYNNFNDSSGAALIYERFLGEPVIIYYKDTRGTPRKLVGKIVEIEGDRLWLENENRYTGETWRGVINCAHAGIYLISTVAGWSGKEDAMTC